ncbi:M23 family metallopeptidase [Leifsonia sp. Leaf264]|uniref:M23 family metallopeptidase n=1 Tax=Leifsonia sp. Leaf264 TaxID=1736314 RepID=UPI000701FAF4|nr:M23 family metallopeptidase [Leifsonia sp. Leaf264]KQP01412.1 hypothetical protein ASF30_02000 [Leifsonia sp. Leaf264]
MVAAEAAKAALKVAPVLSSAIPEKLDADGNPLGPGAVVGAAELAVGVGGNLAVGNVAGAVISGLKTVATNRVFRKWAIWVVALTVGVTAIPLTAAVLLPVLATSSLTSAVDGAQTESVLASGMTSDEFGSVFNEASDAKLPVAIVAALRQQHPEVQLEALADKLAEGGSDSTSQNLLAGHLISADGGFEADQDSAGIAAAQRVKEVWVTALVGVGLSQTDAERTFATALSYALGEVVRCTTSSSPATVDGIPLTADQTSIAQTIIGVTKSATTNVPAASRQRAAEIAIATGLVETHLTNLNHGDLDSLGVFQQRANWGSAEQRTDPTWATAKFLSVLFTIPDWQQGDAGAVAQAVQVSAFPTRYAEQMPQAKAIVASLWSSSTAVPLPADLDFSSTTQPGIAPTLCVTATTGWVLPFDPATGAKISDWFSSGDVIRPGARRHDGVDISMPSGAPIIAAAPGTVLETSGASPSSGLGFYVVVDHGRGAVMRYLHMVSMPLVKKGQAVTAGQQLGGVGTTGDSTGDHLHIDVSVDGKRVDPVPFLLERGVDLTVIPRLGDLWAY